ncbi:MAG: integration host factor subunit beta [Alphaproteobacteria bacterium]|nr:integration host factor subunit beta [Alphaproteobacteria bacterium]
MIKSELIAKVCTRIDHIPAIYTARSVEVIFDTIIKALGANKRVEIRGLGSFSVRKRNSRIARNPKNGAKVSVPAKAVPFFKAGRAVKARLNP